MSRAVMLLGTSEGGAAGRTSAPAMRRTICAAAAAVDGFSGQQLPCRDIERSDTYGFTTILTDISFDEALEKTMAALKIEGFGVLSDLDVQRAMQNKLGADMRPDRILGACNPPLALQALQAGPDIGLQPP